MRFFNFRFTVNTAGDAFPCGFSVELLVSPGGASPVGHPFERSEAFPCAKGSGEGITGNGWPRSGGERFCGGAARTPERIYIFREAVGSGTSKDRDYAGAWPCVSQVPKAVQYAP